MNDQAQAHLAVDARATLGEGPIWDEVRGLLYWVDILAGAVHVHDPSGAADTRIEIGRPVGAVALEPDGGLAVALPGGVHRLRDGALVLFAVVAAEDPNVRANDSQADPAGQLWVGTMDMDARDGAGGLFRVDRQGGVRPALLGQTISNGIGWSPDERRMHYIESTSKTVRTFAYDPASGAMGEELSRFVTEGDAAPDGMAVDAAGDLWIAMWGAGEVRRYAPDGTLRGRLAVPARQATSCAFGGPNLDRLYITSARFGLDEAALAEQPHAGGLFWADVGVRGRPAYRFRPQAS